MAGVVALVTALFAVGGAPSGAATENPCKVLKKREIAAAFGGTVGKAKKGFSTAASTQCEYNVGAGADHPNGTVIVHVMTTGARAAYNGLKKTSASVPIDGVPNSLWSEKTHVVHILQGDVLVGVQGNFIIVDPLPIHFYDAETLLTDLAQIAITRV